MGSFNSVCQLSRKSIEYGERSVVLFVAKNDYNFKDYFYTHMTDIYSPTSFPFITNYDDYGRHILDYNFKAQNEMSWESMRKVGLETIKCLSEDKYIELSNILKDDMENSFIKLFDFIKDSTDLFSNMSFDYFVYLEIVRGYCKDGFKEFNRDSSNYDIVNPHKSVVKYLTEDFKKEFNKIIDINKEMFKDIPNLENKYDNFMDIPFFDLYNFRPKYNLNIIGQEIFREANDKLFYKFIFELLSENNTKKINHLVDGYFFMQSLSKLFLPYNLDIYGSQGSYNYEQVLKIKGEINSLRNSLVEGYLSGLSNFDYSLLFPKEEPTYDEAVDYINRMTTDELLSYYLKSEKYT